MTIDFETAILAHEEAKVPAMPAPGDDRAGRGEPNVALGAPGSGDTHHESAGDLGSLEPGWREPLARPSPEPVPIGNPAGELAVHVVVSDSPDYIREWVATAPSNPVFVHHLQSMQRGSTAYIAFVVSGYKLDSSSRANLEVDFTIRKPDGTVLVTRPGYAKFALVAAEHAFVMADPALDFATDQSDTLGTYRIEAVVTDKFANLNATSVAMLEVVR